MVTTTPRILDTPEKQNVAATLIYACFAFFFGPFFLVLFRLALENNFFRISWLEILFHGINFAVVVSLFREFLQYSWWTVGPSKGLVAFCSGISATVMLVLTVHIARVFPAEEYTWVGAENILPLVEAELFMTPVFVATANPIFGTITMVVLSPVVTCCVLYATVFPRAYNVRPWLGYVAVAILAAVLLVFNGLTWRDPGLQVALFICQLPIHMVCCWAYQKTDTIWTPIFAQTAANLIACLGAIFFLR